MVSRKGAKPSEIPGTPYLVIDVSRNSCHYFPVHVWQEQWRRDFLAMLPSEETGVSRHFSMMVERWVGGGWQFWVMSFEFWVRKNLCFRSSF